MATSTFLARLRLLLRRFATMLHHNFSVLSSIFSRLRLLPLRHFIIHTVTLFRSALHRLLVGTGMASPVDSKISVDELIDLNQRPPLHRRMVHLKTKEECRLGNETIQVWTVELPSKHAEGILKVVKDNVEGQDSIDLQHLRRFAKPRYLPPHVLGKPDKVKELYAVSRAWNSNPDIIMQTPITTAWEYSTPAKNRLNSRPPTLHLLICPVKLVSLEDLHSLLLQHTPFSSSAESWAYPLEIKEVTVPRQSPTSVAQATAWSSDYWPTFYRKTNPFGAHPTTIAKAEDELHYPADGHIGVEETMALARRAAHETHSRGLGVGPGAVIVERNDGTTEVVAVAGDARFKHSPRGPDFDETQAGGCQGNVMSHAVMRAVGMIGRKRLRVASQTISTRAEKAERNFANCGLNHDEQARDDFFLDLPVTPLEQHYFDKDNIKPDGYLCLRLEVFLTHEPCVMCSMALVHSRVGRVIFAHRMPHTGGLTAEVDSNDTGPVGLGYGLCWRKELNWQFMCWEYIENTGERDLQGTRVGDNGNVEAISTSNDPHESHIPVKETLASISSKTLPSSSSSPTDYLSLPLATAVEHQANISSLASVHV